MIEAEGMSPETKTKIDIVFNANLKNNLKKLGFTQRSEKRK